MKALRLIPVAVIALSLNCGSAAAETMEDLGVKVAHELYAAVSMPDLIQEGALKNTQGLAGLAQVRPEWKPLFAEAMRDALTKDQPEIERATGRAFARTFSNDELSAALVVFSDPQAQASLAAISRHESPPNTGMCGGACMRALNSPAGRGFMTKLRTALDEDLRQELIATILPDFLIAFGEKAKAAEAKRASQP